MAPEEKLITSRYGRILADAGRFIDELVGDHPIQLAWRRPAMEMYETNDSFIVRAEFPGVEKDDIDISVSGDTLTVKGERRPPAGVRDEQLRGSEIYYGSFSKSMAIPAGVDAEAVQARHENGMLEITLPKAKETRVTRIQIQTK